MYQQLISTPTVRLLTTMDKNLPDDLIVPSITDAQNIDIQSILGTRLYLSLMEKISTDPSLTGYTNYKTLLNTYITPCLIKYILRRSTIYIQNHYKNIGIVQQNSNNTNPVDSYNIKLMRADAANDAEFYANNLTKYLYEEQDLFPEYKDYNPDSKTNYNAPNNQNNYFSGFVFKKK